jgi:hypothetical protein
MVIIVKQNVRRPQISMNNSPRVDELHPNDNRDRLLASSSIGSASRSDAPDSPNDEGTQKSDQRIEFAEERSRAVQRPRNRRVEELDRGRAARRRILK